MESDICAYLLRQLSERMGDIEQALAAGHARSYEEYCRLVGGYAAMKDMEAAIKEVEQRYLDA